MTTKLTKTNPQIAPGSTMRLALRRILVPIDFSGQSRQALDYAVPLAEQHGARIILLHVVWLPAFAAGDYKRPGKNRARLVSEVGSRLRQLADEAVPPGLTEQVMVCVGVPFEEILRAARDLKADLLAITTHGFTGLTRVLMGSTAERVVRHASCPVLTVRRR